MQNASYAGFSQTGFPPSVLHPRRFPHRLFLYLRSLSFDARRSAASAVLPGVAMAPKHKNPMSSKPKLSWIHKRKRSESESVHSTDHEGGGEGEVEEEEETSPPPTRGATSRSKTQAKSPERRQPARGAKGATLAPSSLSKPSAKRSRTTAQAVNPIISPSELAKLAAAQASPPPKSAPDSGLSIPLRHAEAETSLSHRFLEFRLPENFPQFLVLPVVNDASFGFPLTVLPLNEPTSLPSYDDSNLRRYFRELLSMRDPAHAASWESFEASDWHAQLFAMHIVEAVGKSPTGAACFDSVRLHFRYLNTFHKFYPPVAAHRPAAFTSDHPAVLARAGNSPALPRHEHEPFAEFVPYVEGCLMAPEELQAAHTQYSEHRRVETERRDRLYNDLFPEYTSALGRWEARKVDVVAELDTREQSRAKAVERYLLLRSETLELAVGIANSLGELGVILDVGREQFFKRLRAEIDQRHTTIADALEYVFAPPASSAGTSSAQVSGASSALVTVGARAGSSGSAPPPISFLELDQQTDEEPEEDQLAPVVDNKKRRPACAKGKGKEKEVALVPPPACFRGIKRTAIHSLLYDAAYHSGEPMNWVVPSFLPDMRGRKSKSKTAPEPERLLTHGWQWSRIPGLHRFAEGMETEGIALRWLPALFYFTRGPSCMSCHDHNWACVRYYDGPDLVAACIRCLDQCHACTPVADFDFAYTDGRVLLLNHRLFEAIIRNNTWLFSEVLGSDMVDKLKALAIVMSDGNVRPPVENGDWTPREYDVTPPTTKLGAAAAAVASIAKAAVACRPFLDAAQASDAESLKQVTGMLSELAHVFETTSNDLNSFLAMRNVRAAEQATFLMNPDERMLSELAHVFETTSNNLNSFLAMRNVRAAEQAAFLMNPDERMDNPEDDRNAWESDVPGFALLEGVETGVEGWDGEEGTGGGADAAGGSGGVGTSSGARAPDHVEMRDVKGSGDADPSQPPVASSSVPLARPFSTSTSAVAPPALSSFSPPPPGCLLGDAQDSHWRDCPLFRTAWDGAWRWGFIVGR
ncbi:hypothetical protein B0H17DRAFT_1200834 [Mycena rosella]|uniref:Uncharacterized protein n=1 Tax=Mycena rosella TaxID=1033263 RepID=A0AAD7DI73_MYCRO|nr:hypothetical protein B0H17DRAFT_1200834 [Mycena rosella]